MTCVNVCYADTDVRKTNKKIVKLTEYFKIHNLPFMLYDNFIYDSIRKVKHFLSHNRQIESRIKQCIFALKNHPREIKYNVERGREKRCLYNGKS